MACLCAALGGTSVASAQPLSAAALDCPVPSVPFALSGDCLRTTSEQSVRDALRFANTADVAEPPTVAIECAPPAAPYGISPECARALSKNEVADLVRLANGSATRTQAAGTER